MPKKLMMRLDFRSGLPIYAQIIQHVQAHLASGFLQVGDQLPTIRALADEIGVNFNTVARAYRLLDKERVISTQQGRGTYITEIPTAKVKARLRRDVVAAMASRFAEEALRIGFSKQEVLSAIKEALSRS